MSIPALPNRGSTDWYEWATGLDGETRQLLSEIDGKLTAAEVNALIEAALGEAGDGLTLAQVNAAIAAALATVPELDLTPINVAIATADAKAVTAGAAATAAGTKADTALSNAAAAATAAATADVKATAAGTAAAAADGKAASAASQAATAASAASAATSAVAGKADGVAATRNALTGWFHATGFGAKLDGATNDSPAIQAAMDAAAAAGGGVVYVQPNVSNVAVVGTTLIHPSKVELRFGVGVIVRRGAGLTSNIIRNTALTPISYTGGSITSGSSTLTVTSGAFTSSDVGKSIVVVGAGASYTGGAPLSASIASVTNGTTVVLNRAAGTTVSNAAVRVRGRDSDIALTAEIGVRFEFGASGQQNNTDACPILYRNVDRARVAATDGLLFIQTTDTSGGGKYAIWMYACTQWTVENIRFDVASDGVHVAGRSSNFIIRNIYGYTHDDSVALVGNERLTSTNIDGDLGDMTDFVIENIGTTTDRNGVKLLPCRRAGEVDGFNVRNGTIRNVTGTHLATELQSNAVVFGAANTQAADSVYSGGIIEKINVDGATTSTVRDGVALYNCRMRNITFARIKNLVASNGAIIDDLTIRDSSFSLPDQQYAINLGIQLGDVGPTVGTLVVENCRFRSATVGAGPVSVAGTGASLKVLQVRGLITEQALWGIGQFNNSFDLYATGLNLTATNIMAVGTAGTLATIREFTQTTALTTISLFNGAKVRSTTLGLRTDLGNLTATAGDLVTNTNAALATGVGPVASDGTGWRNIASNAVLAFTAPTAPGLSVTAGDTANTVSLSPPSSNGGSAITGYKVWRATAASVPTAGTPLRTITDGSTSFTDTGLVNGTVYYYVAKATNGVGDGAVSTEQSATPVAGAATSRPGFLPTMSTQPLAWIRADKVTLSGSNVTTATDQSANGFNAIVPSGATGPTLTSSAVNGQPALTFTNGQKLVIPASHATDNTTVLMVFRVADITTSRFLAADCTADGTAKVNTGLNIYTANTNKQVALQIVNSAGGAFGSALSATNSIPGGTFVIGRMTVAAGTAHTLRVGANGNLGTSVTPNAYTAGTAAAFGIGSVGSDGTSTSYDLCELFLCPGMADVDVSKLTQYLATTYNVTGTGTN